MDKKSVTLAVSAGIAIAVAVGGWFWWSKREEKKTAKKYKAVYVLGGPGSGKGTNCARIVKDFGYVHLSAGDLLREERDSGSENGNMIDQMIKDGKIVPADVTIKLLIAAMEKSGASKFLIDGFPRNHNNLTRWNEMTHTICDIQFLLYLNCPESIMEARLLDRGKTSGRSDDNIESIKKRFKTYQADTVPVIEQFRRDGKIREVDSNRESEAVYNDIKIHFQNASFSS